MKTIFIECKYKEKISLPDEIIAQLPDKLILTTTIQYFDSLNNIKEQIEKNNKQVSLFKGRFSKYPGQILGCSIEKSEQEGDFLYIGDGLFHPIAFLIKNKDKKVLSFNPFINKLRILDQEYIEKFEIRQKENMDKYNSSKKIGIIVTTKPGQEYLKKAINLKQKLVEKGKEPYIFLCNTLDFTQLINYNFIECWVNTMCPRISYDDTINIERPIVNINEINN